MVRNTSEEALLELERAGAGHIEWLARVHWALMFGGDADASPPCLGTLAGWCRGDDSISGAGAELRQGALTRLQRACEQMRAVAARLLAARRSGGGVLPDDYQAFLDAIAGYHRHQRALEGMLRRALVETDPLTGLSNRSGMMREVRREWNRAARTGRPCTLALVDLDHFKRVNDTFGHLVGDRVLRLAARFFRRRLRPYDLVFRFGGEEFLFVLPDTDLARARRILDRMCLLMARLPVTLEDGRRMVVTASMGIAQVNPAEPPEAAIARADAAVYRAKHEGRNRVCAAEPCGPPTPQRAPARAKTSGEPGLWTGA